MEGRNFMRLDKLLANMGFGSRKEVKKLIKDGGVRVNDALIKDANLHVQPEKDVITVFGEEVKYQPFIYLMMNKPKGVISATEDFKDPTVIDLLDGEYVHYEPFPVGRLDKDTVGLLLLTNDGQLAHQLLSPKKHVPKTYYAIIDGSVTEKDKELFSRGVQLDDGYVTKPAELTILKSGVRSEIELTITEGKFHQVKRMFEAIGRRVLYLKRLRMGPITLDENLEEGEFRELREEEVKLLKELEK